MRQKLKLFVAGLLLSVSLAAPLCSAPVLAAPAASTTPTSSCGTDSNGKPIPCPPAPTDDALKGKHCNTGASCDTCTGASNCSLILNYINPLVNLLAALVGIAVVASIIIGGVQYGSSAGDPQKVSAAKARIRNAIIALLTFLFLYGLLNFLLPGGLL